MNGVIIAAFQPPINQDMRYLGLIITVSLFPFLLLSCGHKKGIPPEQVESITFYAMPKGIERPSAMVSFQKVKSVYRDSVIVDRDFIREFTTMVNDLKPDRTVKHILLLLFYTSEGLFSCKALIINTIQNMVRRSFSAPNASQLRGVFVCALAHREREMESTD